MCSLWWYLSCRFPADYSKYVIINNYLWYKERPHLFWNEEEINTFWLCLCSQFMFQYIWRTNLMEYSCVFKNFYHFSWVYRSTPVGGGNALSRCLLTAIKRDEEEEAKRVNMRTKKRKCKRWFNVISGRACTQTAPKMPDTSRKERRRALCLKEICLRAVREHFAAVGTEAVLGEWGDVCASCLRYLAVMMLRNTSS